MAKPMWKEKLGNYLIDVSKYFLTGVFVASLIKDMEDMRWLIYVLSGTIAAVLLVSGLILINKKEINNGNIDHFGHGGDTVHHISAILPYAGRQALVAQEQHDLTPPAAGPRLWLR